jgi:hypothetical protein
MLPWVQQLSHIPAKWAAIGDYVLPHKNTRVWQWVIYCRTAVCKHREQAGRLRGVSGQLTKDNTHMTPPSALPHPSFSDSMPSKPVRVSWNPSKHTPTLQWKHSQTLSLALSLSLFTLYIVSFTGWVLAILLMWRSFEDDNPPLDLLTMFKWSGPE